MDITPDFGYTIPEDCVIAAPHIRDESGVCILCGTSPIWSSYQEYVAHFWAYEYEGDRHHAPDSEEAYAYIAESCHLNVVAHVSPCDFCTAPVAFRRIEIGGGPFWGLEPCVPGSGSDPLHTWCTACGPDGTPR